MSGWKTLLFNGGIGLVAILAQLTEHLMRVDWQMILPSDSVPLVVLVIGVANIILRHLTTERAGWRKGRAPS
ncbi:hypothetical protein [Roseibium algae]|uniref:Uncharacterized protein n=1 Tax=Roseibium algae TaxID=3123038 RepID=A0ABU8TIK1_9HYPH